MISSSSSSSRGKFEGRHGPFWGLDGEDAVGGKGVEGGELYFDIMIRFDVHMALPPDHPE